MYLVCEYEDDITEGDWVKLCTCSGFFYDKKDGILNVYSEDSGCERIYVKDFKFYQAANRIDFVRKTEEE